MPSVLGALRCLRARGIPIDFIGGTSQGAFISGALRRRWCERAGTALTRPHRVWPSACYAATLDVDKTAALVAHLASVLGSKLDLLGVGMSWCCVERAVVHVV